MSLDTRKPRKPVLGFANNKHAGQFAHLCRLIRVFAIHFFECVIYKVAIGEIPIFYLVSEAQETGLSLALLEAPKMGLSHLGQYK